MLADTKVGPLCEKVKPDGGAKCYLGPVETNFVNIEHLFAGSHTMYDKDPEEHLKRNICRFEAGLHDDETFAGHHVPNWIERVVIKDQSDEENHHPLLYDAEIFVMKLVNRPIESDACQDRDSNEEVLVAYQVINVVFVPLDEVKCEGLYFESGLISRLLVLLNNCDLNLSLIHI